MVPYGRLCLTRRCVVVHHIIIMVLDAVWSSLSRRILALVVFIFFTADRKNFVRPNARLLQPPNCGKTIHKDA
jgi:hypothetical protein